MPASTAPAPAPLVGCETAPWCAQRQYRYSGNLLAITLASINVLLCILAIVHALLLNVGDILVRPGVLQLRAKLYLFDLVKGRQDFLHVGIADVLGYPTNVDLYLVWS